MKTSLKYNEKLDKKKKNALWKKTFIARSNKLFWNYYFFFLNGNFIKEVNFKQKNFNGHFRAALDYGSRNEYDHYAGSGHVMPGEEYHPYHGNTAHWDPQNR